MPTWTTPSSVTSYVTSIVLTVLGILTQLHITVPTSVPGSVSTWAGIVGYVVAAAALIVNAVSHRNATAKILVGRPSMPIRYKA